VTWDDERRITHAFSVLDEAEQIMKKEGGDPRVVVAASLLHDIGIREAEGPPIARRIMKDLGFDEETVEHVCRIVGSHRSGGDIDTPEFRIVRDAELIVNLKEGDDPPDESFLEKLKTETGRLRAGILIR
jgi:HD superfamily phosphodiesterase